MSVVAITGSSGNIGSRIQHFLEDYDKVSRVVGVDIRPPFGKFGKTEHHLMDVRDPGLLNLFRLESVKTVIHLAFVVNPMHDTGLMHDINIGGLTNVLAATSSCGARHLIVASSSTAFGAFEDNPELLSENDPPPPTAELHLRIGQVPVGDAHPLVHGRPPGGHRGGGPPLHRLRPPRR